jgi:hypothetical protein
MLRIGLLFRQNARLETLLNPHGSPKNTGVRRPRQIKFKGAVVSYDWPWESDALAYLPDRHRARLTAFRFVSDAICVLLFVTVVGVDRQSTLTRSVGSDGTIEFIRYYGAPSALPFVGKAQVSKADSRKVARLSNQRPF